MPEPNVEREWFAAIPFSSGSTFMGRLSLIGGTLVLSDDAVLFKPLGRLGRRTEIRLADIKDVSAYAPKPPRLRISATGNKPLVLIVVPTRTTPVWSADGSARDDAVETICAVLRRQP